MVIRCKMPVTCPECNYQYKKYIGGERIYNNRCHRCGHEWEFSEEQLQDFLAELPAGENPVPSRPQLAERLGLVDGDRSGGPDRDTAAGGSVPGGDNTAAAADDPDRDNGDQAAGDPGRENSQTSANVPERDTGGSGSRIVGAALRDHDDDGDEAQQAAQQAADGDNGDDEGQGTGQGRGGGRSLAAALWDEIREAVSGG